MRLPAPPSWFFWLWVGWILFSQTAAAGTLADALFALFFEPEPGPVDWKHFVAQKGYHVLLFAVFGFLVGRRDGVESARAIAWCIGLSLFAESLQFFSANRNPSVWDALLNVASALTAYRLTVRAGDSDSRQRSSAPLPR